MIHTVSVHYPEREKLRLAPHVATRGYVGWNACEILMFQTASQNRKLRSEGNSLRLKQRLHVLLNVRRLGRRHSNHIRHLHAQTTEDRRQDPQG